MTGNLAPLEATIGEDLLHLWSYTIVIRRKLTTWVTKMSRAGTMAKENSLSRTAASTVAISTTVKNTEKELSQK